jgi:rRNA-processing protein FCF1
MSRSLKKLTGLVADANVLIDYTESAKGVLALISTHVAAIHIPSPVLDEVHQLSEEDVSGLSINVVEPTLDQVMEALDGEGATSFQDRLCFILARDADWSVLTNDTALRRVCRDAGIACIWGMEAMAILVDTKHLSATRAMSVAEKISSINHFITTNVLTRFRHRIGL